MWIKINDVPLHMSLIINISKIEKINSDNINQFFDRFRTFDLSNVRHRNSIDIVERGFKLERVYNHSKQNSIGELCHYEKGNFPGEIIIKESNFKMNSDKYLFEVNYKKMNDDEIYKISSEIYDTFEDAEKTQDFLLSKMNDIEMSVSNIKI